MSDRDFHPASLLFPLMDGVELQRLMDDVREHGLLEPIVLLDDQVLDGRNRLRACELAGVEPRFTEWESHGLTPTEWVVSMNLHRRHLTTAQRTALALDLLPHLETEARERQREAGREHGRGKLPPIAEEAISEGESAAKAAEIVGVGRTAIATAKAIQKRDENGDVVNAMRAGEINVAQAARAVGLEARGSQGTVLDDNGNRDIRGHVKPTYYGKGDKFKETTEPLRRYLKAWEGRGYEFRHVNPREATKRVQVLDELIEKLTAARADLASRAPVARMRV